MIPVRGVTLESDRCLIRRLDADNIAWRPHPARRWPGGRPQQPWLTFVLDGHTFAYNAHAFFLLPAGATAPVPINRHTLPTARKQLVRELFQAAGLPIPAGAAFHRDRRQDALIFAADLPGLVCVKPEAGSLGDLTFPGLRRAGDIAAAIDAVLTHYPTVLVEETAPGDAYRFFLVDPDIAGVKVSRRPHVTGNGRDSISRLLRAENERRTALDQPGLDPIPDQFGLDFMLSAAGLTRDSVSAPGQVVEVGAVSNTQFGGVSRCGFDLVHPAYLTLMRRAFAAVPGLRIAALDVMLSAPLSPPAPGTCHILEVNARPGFATFLHPHDGPAVDIIGRVFDLLRREAAAPAAAGQSRPDRLDAPIG